MNAIKKLSQALVGAYTVGHHIALQAIDSPVLKPAAPVKAIDAARALVLANQMPGPVLHTLANDEAKLNAAAHELAATLTLEQLRERVQELYARIDDSMGCLPSAAGTGDDDGPLDLPLETKETD